MKRLVLFDANKIVITRSVTLKVFGIFNQYKILKYVFAFGHDIRNLLSVDSTPDNVCGFEFDCETKII